LTEVERLYVLVSDLGFRISFGFRASDFGFARPSLWRE
jgi:hypothetical protein